MWAAIAILAALHRRDRTATCRVGSGHHNIVPSDASRRLRAIWLLAPHVCTFWRRFCAAVRRDDLFTDPRFVDTASRRREVLFTDADIPRGPLLDVVEALQQEHLTARDPIMSVTHPTAGEVPMVRPPIRFVGDAAPQHVRPAPPLGEHSRSPCRDLLGLDEAAIDALHHRAVIYALARADDPRIED